MTHTAKEVAEWMRAELLAKPELAQEDAVFKIRKMFGDEHVYTNLNGNLAISTSVLAELKKLAGDEVVWVGGGKYWRRRQKNDGPSRRES